MVFITVFSLFICKGGFANLGVWGEYVVQNYEKMVVVLQ